MTHEQIEYRKYVLQGMASYGGDVAQVVVNNPRFNNDELLLLFDRGNLCFGGTVSNNILTVFTD